MKKPTVNIVTENMVEIITPSGQKFQVVCHDNSESITIFAASSFGSALAIRPRSSSSIELNEVRI